MSRTHIEVPTDEIEKITQDAILVRVDKGRKWIPKSVIKDGIDYHYDAEGEEGVVLEIQEWWALREELI